MTAIVITSYGTLGDNLPLIALGQSLKARGYSVLMAIGPAMHPYALKAGLKAVDNGRLSVSKTVAQQQPQAWNHLGDDFTSSSGIEREEREDAFLDMFWFHLVEGLPCLLEACQDASLLISTPQQDLVAAIVHEKLKISWVTASVTPSLHCQKRKQPKHKPVSNSLSKADRPAIADEMYDMTEEVRQSLQLPPLSRNQWDNYYRCDRTILGSSVHFSQPVAEAPASQTGFWFYEDPDWQTWQPTPNLQDFMEQDPKPLVLSFSSQPLADARAIVTVHAQAAAKLGRPLLIQQGWADFKAEQLPADCDRDRVMFTGFMPQDWLFARAAALIHHGGIGTTARALRQGCPMLVEPFGNDQFFNAKQIIFHKVGAAMHPMRLQADEVAQVLQNKVLTAEYRQRATVLGTKIRDEMGLENACDLLESWL
ncbi:MAG: glycosyltransferase [Cyanobacteria bacterium P01_B01_bin.77]